MIVCVCERERRCIYVSWHVYVGQTSAFWSWSSLITVVSVMYGLTKHALEEIWEQTSLGPLLRARNTTEWE